MFKVDYTNKYFNTTVQQPMTHRLDEKNIYYNLLL